MARTTIAQVSSDLDKVDKRLSAVEDAVTTGNANSLLLTHMVEENTNDITDINSSFRWFMRTVIFILLSGVATALFTGGYIL